MSDIYDELEEIKDKHEIEKHNESKERYQVDPSCLKCYSTNEIEIGDWFERFWRIFQKVILEAKSYNRNTYAKLLEYIILIRKDGEERYPSSRKKRDREFEKRRKEGEKLLDIVVRSIRYENKPDYLKMGVTSVIKRIVNAKFEEWLDEMESATIKSKGYGTMRHFKEILHLEENITEEENRGKVKKFQKSITYQWWDRNKYPRPWIDDDLTDKIIEKIVGTKGFVEEYSDVGELESSDNIGELSSNEGDEHMERIYRNHWLENGYEIDIEEIRRIINFGVEYEIMKTKDFMGNYMIIKELDDEGVIEELRKWYSTNAIECPLCNRMLLTREAVEYNEEFIGKICRSCSEREEEDIDGIDKRIRELKKISGIISSEGSGEKSDDEESEKEDNTDESEKIGEILSPEEYEEWNENIENINEEGIENIINTGGFNLSQESDSSDLFINPGNINSDTESELSDYNLQDLFQENILLNMGATRDEMREDFRAALLAATGHDIGGNWAGLTPANPLANAIEDAGNIAGGIVNMPLFYGKENEDVAFTAIGKAPGNNGERQAAYAAAHLRGAAIQWYNEMKETNAGNLTNWADADNDNDLKHRIKRRFTREDVRRRKIRQNPGSLNDAINLARREEEARNELLRKVGNIPDKVYPEIGKGRNTEQNVETNVRYNKPLNENYEDELVEKLEKMRIAKLEKQIQNMERELNNNGNRNQLNQRRNNRAPINYDEITCFRCNRRGHFATRCPLGNNIRRNERRVNLMNIGENEDYDYEDEESDDNENYEYEDYNDPQLYNYDRDLYKKDNPVQERRRSNRINPKKEWQVFGKPNLEKEIARQEKQKQRAIRNRKEIPMEEDEENELEDEQPMYSSPIGPSNTNIPKRNK
ncbi:hypothetical protein RhiirA4_482354 [Rhizophagus irregularis]|uniref:CCHC-type domain-containing protein n=1 Tax=Rhizophagus irregularis TaxID=588596 RepID=A0A2I1HL21_9GLOM|nr:hypothetical protein RhiirA4_482354 [Rhizophagus irregularis]